MGQTIRTRRVTQPELRRRHPHSTLSVLTAAIVMLLLHHPGKKPLNILGRA
jgi:hypothetical protein